MNESPPGNMKAVLRLRHAAQIMATLPSRMAEFYANGGPGVGQGVVGDRFSGQGNARFVPLSEHYAIWKAEHSKDLNKAQKGAFKRGSKLISVRYRQGYNGGYRSVDNSLPILVLSGATRAAVTDRKHAITQNGDTAYIKFENLTPWAKYLHTGTKRMPQRSPVNMNADDKQRVNEFAHRVVRAAVGEGAQDVSFGSGVPRIL